MAELFAVLLSHWPPPKLHSQRGKLMIFKKTRSSLHEYYLLLVQLCISLVTYSTVIWSTVKLIWKHVRLQIFVFFPVELSDFGSAHTHQVVLDFAKLNWSLVLFCV